jgi:hypothetical protein
MPIELSYIKENFQEEDTFDLVEMLEGETITHQWVDGKNYALSVRIDELDTRRFQETIIYVEDEIGRFENLIRYPSSTDSFYDSCIDAIKQVRKRADNGVS